MIPIMSFAEKWIGLEIVLSKMSQIEKTNIAVFPLTHGILQDKRNDK